MKLFVFTELERLKVEQRVYQHRFYAPNSIVGTDSHLAESRSEIFVDFELFQ